MAEIHSTPSFEELFARQISPFEGCTYVIFGASGDLTKKKLLPSIYQLYKDGMLPKKFQVVGYARTKMSNEEYLLAIQEHFEYEDKEFFKFIHYHFGGYDSVDDIKVLEKVFQNYSPNRIFYFSLPPDQIRVVSRSLKRANLITKNSGGLEHTHTVIGEEPFCRLVIEKPFGSDLESAIKLNRFLNQHFSPSQLFVIDHYLGKEPIQNILFFRFANTIFENLWNSRYVDKIQLTMYEKISVDKRAGYFDSAGILLDMIQSHGLQILAMAMMEPPIQYEAQYIRSEKSKLLAALLKFSPEDVVKNVVRAQYEGYLDERGVAENSKTETLVAIKTFVNNWRWSGVPIFIRSAKATSMKRSEIVVTFKGVPHNIFGEDYTLESNEIVFRFQPETFINIKVMNKIPGNKLETRVTELGFPYDKEFEGLNFTNGYDRIVYTSLINDASLFLSIEELEAQWKFIDSIVDVWNSNKDIPLYTYPKGSLGPQAIMDLIGQDGGAWNE